MPLSVENKEGDAMDWLSISLLIIMPVISFVLGCLFFYEWRKLYARMQLRRGPYFPARWYQVFADVLKLLSKKPKVPETAKKRIFYFSPFFALACTIISMWFVPVAGFSPFSKFPFSLIIVSYLLFGPPLSYILAGASSGSPYGSVGGKREALLTLAYEVPFILSLFSIALLAGKVEIINGIPVLHGTLCIEDIVKIQTIRKLKVFGIVLPAWFLLINPFAAIAIFLTSIAKLHMKPFDIVEAEQEIVYGPLAEYSGWLLGLYKIESYIKLFLVSALITDFFLAGGIIGSMWLAPLFFIVVNAVIVFLWSIICVVMPRYRPKDAFKWLLKYPLLISIIALIWSYLIYLPWFEIPFAQIIG